MKLNALIQDIGAVEIRGSLDIDVTAITGDSREVVPGSLFIAVKGFASDGHQYIASAIEKGAVVRFFRKMSSSRSAMSKI